MILHTSCSFSPDDALGREILCAGPQVCDVITCQWWLSARLCIIWLLLIEIMMDIWICFGAVGITKRSFQIWTLLIILTRFGDSRRGFEASYASYLCNWGWYLSGKRLDGGGGHVCIVCIVHFPISLHGSLLGNHIHLVRGLMVVVGMGI